VHRTPSAKHHREITMIAGRRVSKFYPIIMGCVLVLLAGMAVARTAVESKPLSLITTGLVTKDARFYVPVVDLAKAMGGTATYVREGSRCSITVGTSGVVRVNAEALKDFVKGRKATTVVISVGGQDVAIDNWEVIMLRPAEWAVSLDFLAKLFGGSATMSATDRTWKIPPGDPGTPLEFR
jgi:hypothetical protein